MTASPLSPWERGLSPRPPLHSCNHRLGASQAHQLQFDEQRHQQRLAADENAAEQDVLSTVTMFGTPNDVTLAELALETFFPADEASAEYLRQLAQE